MGDLGVETAVERVGEGRYRATLDDAWAIWGPMGGYIASVALRAIGAETPTTRPASFFCQYLGVAAFATVDIEVTTVKAGRTVAFHQALITQGGRPMLSATVCSVGESAAAHALAHVDGAAPDVPDPEGLPTPRELWPDEERPPFPFWNNFDQRPLSFATQWPPAEPMEPTWRQWHRFVPAATFDDDPWLDACRAVVLVDVQSWPAAHRPHAYRALPVYAPSLDLYVAFHQPPPWGEWLLADGHSAVADGGLMGWTGRLWGRDRRLLASGGGQLIVRSQA
ncbi:MAG: acyl-CoA thioesterase [Acidimicrobiaceae bacterium]